MPPATIDAATPWIAQATKLVSDSELGGLTKELSPATTDLARLIDRATELLPQTDLAGAGWTSLCVYTDGGVYPSASMAGVPALRCGSVLDAALDAGLSGPSRLHDLFVTCEAMTPGEYKALGERLEVRWGIHEVPLGRVVLAGPGPITSAMSAGCHELLRTGPAVPATSTKGRVESCRPPVRAAPGEDREHRAADQRGARQYAQEGARIQILDQVDQIDAHQEGVEQHQEQRQRFCERIHMVLLGKPACAVKSPGCGWLAGGWPAEVQ